MRPGRVLSWLALGLILILISVGIAAAHHSYHLTVHQLMSGLQKAGSPDKKGFVLVDVRTAQEHFSGMIPGTDINIDYEVITERHRESSLSGRPAEVQRAFVLLHNALHILSAVGIRQSQRVCSLLLEVEPHSHARVDCPIFSMASNGSISGSYTPHFLSRLALDHPFAPVL